ncbi:hypothetical protein [Mesonia aestuariivivens]|uniref:Uncharacterized protein n=1 Tax=Mesonia aestuariivivens TaxID=2796128 RepID=A0ABS6W3M3_9FLAO|nr:hypothetical protein [Mesonia aestuariivivens]MBW2962465.1 hypothetical protein [Mesonia aestuariivivens]
MIAKFLLFSLFIIAEITLGIYSLAISESLLARFLFFILSAFIVCTIVIKISNKLLPEDDKRNKIVKRRSKIKEA